MNKKQLIVVGIVAIGIICLVNRSKIFPNVKENNMELGKLTQADFVPKIHDWTKVSRYALTEDDILIRYEGHIKGFPIFYALYKGWWEISDGCVGIRAIAEAKPISEKEARKKIHKEEKPRQDRPKERDSWVCTS